MKEFFSSLWNAAQDFFAFLLGFEYENFISIIFTNMTLDLGIKIAVIYLLLLWLGVAIRVTKDILNRTNSILLQMFCILLILVGTPLGIFLYLLIRPSRTLYERYYEELPLEEDDAKQTTSTNTPKEQIFHIVIELKSDMLVDGGSQKWKLSGVYDKNSGENLTNITLSPEKSDKNTQTPKRKEIHTNFSEQTTKENSKD